MGHISEHFPLGKNFQDKLGKKSDFSLGSNFPEQQVLKHYWGEILNKSMGQLFNFAPCINFRVEWTQNNDGQIISLLTLKRIIGKLYGLIPEPLFLNPFAIFTRTALTCLWRKPVKSVNK